MKIAYLYLTLLFCVHLTAQSAYDLRIGQWKAHLPFKRSSYVTASPNKIYFATEFGLLALDREDQQPTFITRVEGLSDAGLQRVKYHVGTETLLIAYSDGNLDLYTNDGIVNYNNIKENDRILGRKSINDIIYYGDKAYLACSFGLVEFDMVRREFGFTTFIDFEAFSLRVFDGYFYLGTENGIYRAPVNGVNLADFQEWQLLGPGEGIPAGYFYANQLAVMDDRLYAVIEDRILIWNGTAFEQILYDQGYRVRYLSDDGDRLLAGLRCITNCDSKVFFLNADGSREDVPAQCFFRPNYGIMTGNALWFADEGDEYRFTTSLSSPCQALTFNTPYSANVSEITTYQSQVLVASGGVDATYSYRFRRDGLFIYKDGLWSYLNVYNNQTLGVNDFWDVFTVKVRPSDGVLFAGSYLSGLARIQADGEITIYDQNNSTIGGTVGDPGRERISGLAFDRNENLWIANYLASKPISVMTPEGKWQNFSIPTATTLTQIAIDRNGYKWFAINGDVAGLLVMDSGQDPVSTADDRFKVVNTTNSELPNNLVNCVEADREGQIWVGTTQGLVTFDCGENVFNSDGCPGRHKIVTFDGVNGKLLSTQDIRCVAVDGANRKWVGTRNGIFVLSPDGLELIAKYNESNSPLINNSIIDIAIDEDGIAWIGTDEGIITLRTEASAAKAFYAPQVYAFPNPVRPEYQGIIAIKGLVEDADVKITDTGGQLVYETQANGGQAIWDGTDFTGQRVASGVYLVFSNATEVTFGKPEAAVTKILILFGK
ncbi:MAG: hypothetical protein KDC57_01515 [Saprospiraceae bacterium]|nr:hypothetical protein [Saprospiraceae bacterium]